MKRRNIYLLLFIILSVSTAIMITAAKKVPTTTSSDVDSPEIRTAISQIDLLALRESRWHAAYLGLIFGTVVLSLAVFVAQYFESRLAKERADAQAELGRLKDLAVKRSFKGKDLEIAKLNVTTAGLERVSNDAREKAANAEARAATAESHLADSNARVKQAEAQIAEQVAKVKEADARIAEAQRGAAEANRIAESERLARVQLEIRLAPRTLTDSQQAMLVAALTPFSKTEATAVVWGDTYEIQTIGGTIISCLRKAGWVVGVSTALGGGGNTRGIPIGVRADADVKTRQAANTLIAQLQSMGLVAGPWEFDQMGMPGTAVTDDGPRSAPVKIFIGSKP